MIRAGGVEDRLTAENRAANLFNLSCGFPPLLQDTLKRLERKNYVQQNYIKNGITGNCVILCFLLVVSIRNNFRRVKMLTREENEYLYIAHLISKKQVSVRQMLKYFEDEPEESANMINFWLTYTPFTQGIVHYLAIEKLRINFENSYKKEVSIWNLTMRKLRLIWKCRKISSGLKDLQIHGDMNRHI